MELNVFNQSVNNRFQTVIKTIEDKNNTFFDGYLNLLEGTIKFILDENGINYDSTKTCGLIFRTEEVKFFFLNGINIDEKMYNKVLDYVKKSNDSKHKEEKEIDVNAVLVRMEFYYSFINKYYDFKQVDNILFDATNYFTLFGKTERVNKQYKEELNKTIKELENAYFNNKLTEDEYNKCKQLLKNTEIEKLSLDEQNKILKNQLTILLDVSSKFKIDNKLDVIEEKIDSLILKSDRKKTSKEVFEERQNNNEIINNFLKSSKKEYPFVDLDCVSLEKRKLLLWFSGLSVLVTGLMAAIFVTKLEYYTTGTLFENIFMIQVALQMFYSLSYKNKISDEKLQKITSNKFEYEYKIKLYRNELKEKNRYKIIRIFTYIFIPINIIFASWHNNCITAIVFEVLFLISTIVFTIFTKKINRGYETLIFFTGRNNIGNVITLCYDLIRKRFLEPNELDIVCKTYKIEK